MFDEAYVHVRIVPAMKQPMEADVSGGTAEAVFEETLSQLSLFVGDDGESADLCRSDNGL